MTRATTAAITSLSTNGVYVFGTGYDFGTGGNFEGSFAVAPSDGSIVWIDDCLGDTYSAWPARNVSTWSATPTTASPSAASPRRRPGPGTARWR